MSVEVLEQFLARLHRRFFLHCGVLFFRRGRVFRHGGGRFFLQMFLDRHDESEISSRVCCALPAPCHAHATCRTHATCLPCTCMPHICHTHAHMSFMHDMPTTHVCIYIYVYIYNTNTRMHTYIVVYVCTVSTACPVAIFLRRSHFCSIFLSASAVAAMDPGRSLSIDSACWHHYKAPRNERERERERE